MGFIWFYYSFTMFYLTVYGFHEPFRACQRQAMRSSLDGIEQRLYQRLDTTCKPPLFMRRTGQKG